MRRQQEILRMETLAERTHIQSQADYSTACAFWYIRMVGLQCSRKQSVVAEEERECSSGRHQWRACVGSRRAHTIHTMRIHVCRLDSCEPRCTRRLCAGASRLLRLQRPNHSNIRLYLKLLCGFRTVHCVPQQHWAIHMCGWWLLSKIWFSRHKPVLCSDQAVKLVSRFWLLCGVCALAGTVNRRTEYHWQCQPLDATYTRLCAPFCITNHGGHTLALQ